MGWTLRGSTDCPASRTTWSKCTASLIKVCLYVLCACVLYVQYIQCVCIVQLVLYVCMCIVCTVHTVCGVCGEVRWSYCVQVVILY